MRQFITAVIFSALVSQSVYAASINSMQLSNGVSVIVAGPISPGDASKFRQSINDTLYSISGTDKSSLVILNSTGGVISEAADMADLIRNRRLAVTVHSNAECLSACFLMFMAAPKKLLMHGARIGVHSAATSDGAETSGTKATTVDFARLAKEAGAPNSVVGKIVSVKPDEMLYLSDDELKLMGAHFIDDDPIPQPQISEPPQAANTHPPQPAASTSNKAKAVSGRLVKFECGDNCYLTILTDDGNEQTGLCGTGPCDAWNRKGFMPQTMVGKRVTVTLGIGQQVRGEDEPGGHMISFETVKFSQ